LLTLLILLYIRRDAIGLALGMSIGGIMGDTAKYIAAKRQMKG
jgi:hypothetical protein